MKSLFSNTYSMHRSALALAVVAAATMLATPAHATPASGPGVTAVNAARAALPSDLFQHNFSQTFANANVPQWTPDGGVFQYFFGSIDQGAIYWRPGASAAFPIYGAILSYFKQHGFEVGEGYPSMAERNATAGSFCNVNGLVATREQWFGPALVLCWSAQNGAWERPLVI